MFRRSRLLLLAVAVSAASTWATTVPAQTLGDIFDKVEDARAQAALAATRAAAARNVADSARSAAEEVRDNVRSGVEELTPELRAAVGDAVEDAKADIAEERAGLDAFTADGGCSALTCQPFRDDLIEFVRDLDTLANGAFVVAEVPSLSFEVDPLVTVLESLPGRLLYPAYRALAVETGVLEDGLAQTFRDAAEAMLVVSDLKPQSQPAASRASAVHGVVGLASTPPLLRRELDACRTRLEHLDLVEHAVGALGKAAVAAKVVKSVLEALGEKQPKSTVGIHGYTLVTIEDPAKFGKLAKKAESLAEGLANLADKQGQVLDHCKVVGVAAELAEIAVETQLARCRNHIGLYLPAHESGHLNTIGDLIDSRIATALRLGYGAATATQLRDAGYASMAAGDHFGAYRAFCRAYRELRRAMQVATTLE